jgi:hypothetical protein
MADLTLTHYLPFELLLPNATQDSNGIISCDLTGFVGGAITATTLGATGAVTFDDTLDVLGLTTLDDLDVAGDTALAGDLDVAGTVRLPALSPLNQYSLQVLVSDIIGANGKVGYVVVPLGGAGTIEQIDAVCDALTATGNLVLTASIGATPVTGGVVTIAAATAAGTKATPAEPSAANVVAAGSVLKVVASGAQDAAGSCMLTLSIQRTIPA